MPLDGYLCVLTSCELVMR